jgi:hypothetical protein
MGWRVALPDTGDQRTGGNLGGRGTNGVIISLPGPDTFNPLQCWLSRKLSRKISRPMDPASKRTENRTPLKVDVDLSSLDVRIPATGGITENISPRGARVLTSKPWKPNERLNLRSLGGNFRSRARVVYCVPVDNDQFAVGLQLFAAAGSWRSPN